MVVTYSPQIVTSEKSLRKGLHTGYSISMVKMCRCKCLYIPSLSQETMIGIKKINWEIFSEKY